MAFFIDVDQLREPWDIGVDDLIPENDGEGFIADQVLRAQHGMTQAEGFGLPHVTEVRKVRDLSDLMEHLALASAFQIFF
jgi:hypothetical protein